MNNGICVPSIIDIEASGFGAASYPIEFGVCLSSDVRCCMLIKPEPDWVHWDNQAQQLHGIDRSTLETRGRSVQEVAVHFNALLAGQVLYSDGWVVDKPWISRLFHAARVPMQFSVQPIEQIMTELQFEIWDETKRQLTEESSEHRHRASHDALIIQQTFLRSRALSNNGANKQFAVSETALKPQNGFATDIAVKTGLANKMPREPDKQAKNSATCEDQSKPDKPVRQFTTLAGGNINDILKYESCSQQRQHYRLWE